MTHFISESISDEIIQAYPDCEKGKTFDQTLINCVNYTGNKFFMIIDEWDAPIRETPQIEQDYLKFLRMLFKSSGTTSKIFAATYITGILPIKKDGSQSAISDFREYSVMQAVTTGKYKSYWKKTSAAETLITYIDMDQGGLQDDIARLIAGESIVVDTDSFQNDVETFTCKDDVLTLLIHLGYLAYDSEKKNVRIPNEEIKREFQRSIHEVKQDATKKRLAESEQLFADTIQKNAEAVARQIEKIHMEETAPLHYNKEDSLRSIIKLAYYTYRDHYLQFEELPAGVGFADVVYIPLPGSNWPALVIELKWDDSAEGAIDQILKKQYPSVLQNLNCPILLVGISYNKNEPAGQRKHTCKIIEYTQLIST